MCCGAGNLACALAVHVRTAESGQAISPTAASAGRARNAAHLGLESRLHVYQGDLFAGFAGLGLEGTIDVIVCNPPYISTGRLSSDRAGLLDHEPREAFDGGPYGLTIHQRVLKEALPFLKPGGWLLFEIGLGQDRQIKLLFERARTYDAIGLAVNDAGEPRVAFGRVKDL